MKIFTVTAMLIVALSLAGCRSTASSPAESPDAPAPVNTGNALLESIRDRNYRDFAVILKNGPAAKMTENDFKTSYQNIHDQFGDITAYRYLTSLQTPLVRNLIWQVTFQRKDSKGDTVNQDLLFRLVTGEIDGRTTVLSFGFL